MSLPYYKRFPRDFLEATIGFSLELKGAYTIVLDLIYMRGGGLPDDPQYIAGQLGCSVRKWNSLRGELVSLGKLSVENGLISNSRADVLLEETRTFREKQAENRSHPNKNNGLQLPKADHLEPDTEEVRKTTANAVVPHTPSSPTESKSSGRARATARGNRIAPNWAPTITDYAFASGEGMTREDTNREADKFRDYWIAKSGREACKLDWSATWRNWVRSDFRKRNGSAPGNSSRNGGRTDAFDRLAERLSGGSAGSDAWGHDDTGTEGGNIIDITPSWNTG